MAKTKRQPRRSARKTRRVARRTRRTGRRIARKARRIARDGARRIRRTGRKVALAKRNHQSPWDGGSAGRYARLGNAELINCNAATDQLRRLVTHTTDWNGAVD
jgi:hypothetical protein